MDVDGFQDSGLFFFTQQLSSISLALGYTDITDNWGYLQSAKHYRENTTVAIVGQGIPPIGTAGVRPKGGGSDGRAPGAFRGSGAVGAMHHTHLFKKVGRGDGIGMLSLFFF